MPCFAVWAGQYDRLIYFARLQRQDARTLKDIIASNLEQLVGRNSNKRLSGENLASRPDWAQTTMGLDMQTQHTIMAREPLKSDGTRNDETWPFSERRLAAVMVADVVGYTRLMGVDESRTYARYKAHRRELIDPKIAELGARVVKSTGDGVLAEFQSPLDAVRCAIHVQQNMVERNQAEPPDHRIVFRIGLSYGTIIAEAADIYGDEVNIAARLQAIAPPGGIAMSDRVVDLVQEALCLQLDDLGVQPLRNMARSVHVYTYRQPHCG